MTVAIIKWILQLVVMIGVNTFTPLIMVVAVWFQDRVTGRMPLLLRFLETYDDLGPDQGMYEPKVKMIYDRFGWRAKQWYWLGIRNQCYTLFFWMAPVIDYYGVARYTHAGSRGDPHWNAFIEQFGTVHFEFGWSWRYSATKGGSFGFGWKIFSVDRFLTGDKTGTDKDRPLFYLQVKPYSTI